MNTQMLIELVKTVSDNNRALATLSLAIADAIAGQKNTVESTEGAAETVSPAPTPAPGAEEAAKAEKAAKAKAARDAKKKEKEAADAGTASVKADEPVVDPEAGSASAGTVAAETPPPAPQPAPAPAPAPSGPSTPTQADLVRAFMGYMNKQADRAPGDVLLAKYGVDRVTAMPADLVPAFIEECHALTAAMGAK